RGVRSTPPGKCFTPPGIGVRRRLWQATTSDPARAIDAAIAAAGTGDGLQLSRAHPATHRHRPGGRTAARMASASGAARHRVRTTDPPEGSIPAVTGFHLNLSLLDGPALGAGMLRSGGYGQWAANQLWDAWGPGA
ncbi:hypothetical protein JBE27_44020, partial [Streptomyces albiflaviniger]|nr:hypothetical protein [Streptomyces albiflaviniger]